MTGSLGAPAPRPEPASRRATVRRCRLRRDDVSPRLGPRGRHPAAELRIVPPPTFHPGDINLLSAALVSPGKDPCGLGRCDAARCTTTRGRRRRGPSPPRFAVPARSSSVRNTPAADPRIVDRFGCDQRDVHPAPSKPCSGEGHRADERDPRLLRVDAELTARRHRGVQFPTEIDHVVRGRSELGLQ